MLLSKILGTLKYTIKCLRFPYMNLSLVCLISVHRFLKVNSFVASEAVCESIAASHTTGLGDRGNSQVTKELDKFGKLRNKVIL